MLSIQLGKATPLGLALNSIPLSPRFGYVKVVDMSIYIYVEQKKGISYQYESVLPVSSCEVVR